MNTKNIVVVLLLGAVLPCFVLGSPVSEEDSEHEILFEEPAAVVALKKPNPLNLLVDFIAKIEKLYKKELSATPKDALNDWEDAALAALKSVADYNPLELLPIYRFFSSLVKYQSEDRSKENTKKLNDESFAPNNALNDWKDAALAALKSVADYNPLEILPIYRFFSTFVKYQSEDKENKEKLNDESFAPKDVSNGKKSFTNKTFSAYMKSVEAILNYLKEKHQQQSAKKNE